MASTRTERQEARKKIVVRLFAVPVTLNFSRVNLKHGGCVHTYIPSALDRFQDVYSEHILEWAQSE